MPTSIRNLDAHWRQRAACRGADPAKFDDSEKCSWPPQRAVEAAHDFCHTCPVQTTCRRKATVMEGTGVWGGQWRHRPGTPDSRRPIEVTDLLAPEFAPRVAPPVELTGRQGDVWQALPVVGFTTTGRVAGQTRMDQRHTSQVLALLAAHELAFSPTRGVWRRATPSVDVAPGERDERVAS